MEDHFNLTDIEFETQFKNCELKPSLFSHEAHLRLAWIHINAYGIGKAIQNVEQQLEKFVEYLGETGKFNKTLTVAAVKVVYHFMLKSKSTSFKEFMREFPQLKTDFRRLINTHYGINIFSSDKAKTEYVEPDLVPFD